ncbi:MAG: hypothetical protein CMP59_08680 [Flavobacteriales bacterium]|nr:hypothetical protein [Flavobacteriales bacterium]|tara:strand:- start:2557 stop:3702 length:1146 start_codon:yes stop_codon:yes gene_type:complete
MNRIVLVGNGFDISCGLKTSYDDFILWYLKRQLLKLCRSQNRKYKDLLIEITLTQPNNDLILIIKDLNKLSELLDLQNISFNLPNRQSRPIGVLNLTCAINSPILKYSIDSHKWSSIEQSYYYELLELFQEFDNTRRANKYEKIGKIKRLNDQLNYIKQLLIEYLSEIEENIDAKVHTNKYLKDIFNKIKKSPYERDWKISMSEDEIRKNELEDIYYFSFNYTSLLDTHLSDFNVIGQNTLVFNIHGYLDNPESIIFGYGDDSHKDYYNLEQSGIDDFIINIKSFHYPSDEIYETLIGALDSGIFEVFILGHSLGLSDRVLLKTVFEHRNCRSIRLFHRNSLDDHIKKRLALSRHFEDKIKMRERIVRFDPNDILDSDEVD